MKKSTKEDIKWFLLIVSAGVVAEFIAELALNRISSGGAGAGVASEIIPAIVLKADTQGNRQILVV